MDPGYIGSVSLHGVLDGAHTSLLIFSPLPL